MGVEPLHSKPGLRQSVVLKSRTKWIEAERVIPRFAGSVGESRGEAALKRRRPCATGASQAPSRFRGEWFQDAYPQLETFAVPRPTFIEVAVRRCTQDQLRDSCAQVVAGRGRKRPPERMVRQHTQRVIYEAPELVLVWSATQRCLYRDIEQRCPVSFLERDTCHWRTAMSMTRFVQQVRFAPLTWDPICRWSKAERQWILCSARSACAIERFAMNGAVPEIGEGPFPRHMHSALLCETACAERVSKSSTNVPRTPARVIVAEVEQQGRFRVCHPLLETEATKRSGWHTGEPGY